MNSLRKIKKVNTKVIHISIFFCVILLFITTLYIGGKFNSVKVSESPTSYVNKVEGYSLIYPPYYKSKESNIENSFNLFLTKNDVWNDGGYNLDKGVSIIIENYKNTNLSREFVEKENRNSLDTYKDGVLSEEKINGKRAIILTYAKRHDLGVPYVKKVYLEGTTNTLEISYVIGESISKEDYDEYSKEFNSIVESVRFL